MATEHSAIDNADLHEPKDVSAATANQCYLSDGAGSGTWTKHSAFGKVYLFTIIDDISTAQSAWVPCPVTGNITTIYTIIDAAITGADATITAEINTVAVTGSSITITQSGSAVGDVDSSSPSATRAVTPGDSIEIITDGGSSTASKAVVTIEITTT